MSTPVEVVWYLLSWQHHWLRNDVLETALPLPAGHFHESLLQYLCHYWDSTPWVQEQLCSSVRALSMWIERFINSWPFYADQPCVILLGSQCRCGSYLMKQVVSWMEGKKWWTNWLCICLKCKITNYMTIIGKYPTVPSTWKWVRRTNVSRSFKGSASCRSSSLECTLRSI